MKTLLVSFFGSSNLGDLLISSSLENKISGYTDIISMDYLGHEKVENMNIEKPLGTTPEKSSLKSTIKKLNGATGINQLVMRLKKNMDLFSYPDFEANIDQVDALIIGGGNMIFDLESDTLSAKRFDYYVSKAKEKNLPVFAISLGIGPFHNKYQQKYTVEALSKCDYITFRDPQSLALFKEFNTEKENVEVVPDPVFYMDYKLTEESDKKMGFNIINPEIFSNQMDPVQVKEDYVTLITELLSTFDEEIVLYNTEAKDYVFCQEVYEHFSQNDRVHLQKVNSLSELFTVYSQLKVVIGTRMHSMITAFSQNIPIIGLSWQQKVDAMFGLLNDSESVFSLVEIPQQLDAIIKQVKAKLEDESDYHQKTAEMLRVKEQINTDYLNEMYK